MALVSQTLKKHRIFFLLFLLTSGISLAEKPAKSVQPLKQRVIASGRVKEENKFQFGFSLSLDGLWGKASTSDTLSKGAGYSLGLSTRYFFLKSFSSTLITSYKYMRLGKALDGSGTTSVGLKDPSPATFDQSIKYIGVMLLISYQIQNRISGPTWWIDSGVEYLHPLRAEQTVVGITRGFTAGKNLAALIGVSADFPILKNYVLITRTQLFYSLVGGTSNAFYGARILAGFYL